MNRAQVAYEYLMIVFMILFAFTSWIMIFNSYQDYKAEAERFRVAESLSLAIQDDIYVYASFGDGFQTYRQIPQNIRNTNYTISLNEDVDTLNIKVDNVTFSRDLPNSTGYITKGQNKFTVANGEVCINAC